MRVEGVVEEAWAGSMRVKGRRAPGRTSLVVPVALALIASGDSRPTAAQSLAPDTLHLPELMTEAQAVDPRSREFALNDSSARLRIDNLGTDRLPVLSLGADAGYQSEVVDIPVMGADIRPPPNERYEARIRGEWAIWDGGATGARQASVTAGLAREQATLRADLHELRVRVADAFFSILLLQEQREETALWVEDLGARLAEARAQVDEGAAIPADTAALRADLLIAELQTARLESERDAALQVLSRLVGRPVPGDAVLVVPEVGTAVHGAVARLQSLPPGATLPEDLRLHPRFSAFDAARTVEEAQLALTESRRRPVVGAFGQLAWGNPGDRQFSEDPHEYWRAGLQLQWRPWDWGRPDREAEELEVRLRVVDAREAAFSDGLLRSLEGPTRRIRFLAAALETDAEIITLREEVERQARVRWQERVLPVWAYTDARTDVVEARLALRRHEVELAREQVRYLDTLGMEIREP
jgi:outer membrane protein TolC